MKKQYVRYQNVLDFEQIYPIRNEPTSKSWRPSGGFFVTPKQTSYGFKEYYQQHQKDIHYHYLHNVEQYHWESPLELTCKNGAKIVHIYSGKDVDRLPQINPSRYRLTPEEVFCAIDFEELVRQGYDGIQIHWTEERFKDSSTWAQLQGLYYKMRWEYDELCIFNADIIESDKIIFNAEANIVTFPLLKIEMAK